jgi:transcriptional regulator with XRE-family HTH domain
MLFSQRLQQLLTELGVNQLQFCNKIGYNSKNFNHVLNGRNLSPKIELIAAIMEGYPQVNPFWLVLGKGEMFLGENNPQDEVTKLLKEKVGMLTWIIKNHNPELLKELGISENGR